MAIKVNVLMVLKRKEGDRLPLSTGLCQSCFRYFNQSGERYFVKYSDISQDLTVDFNRGFFCMRVLKNKKPVSSGVIVVTRLDTASVEKLERI